MAAEPKVGVMLRLPVELYQEVKALVAATEDRSTFTSVTIQALRRLVADSRVQADHVQAELAKRGTGGKG